MEPGSAATVTLVHHHPLVSVSYVGSGKGKVGVYSWRTTLPGQTYPHHVVYSVDIGVTHVDTNGPQGEAILLASSVDDDGRP